MPVQVSSSTACRVQEAFKSSSCTSDRDGRSFLHPEGKGVGKGFVENSEQTIQALQQFALTFHNYTPSSHWQGMRSS